MSLEERKVFVDELFSVFEASGCDTLSAMTKIRVKEMRAIVKRMRLIKNDSGEKVRQWLYSDTKAERQIKKTSPNCHSGAGFVYLFVNEIDT